MEELGFGPIGLALNGGIRIMPDWNSLEWRKLILAWNAVGHVRLDWNCLALRKSILALTGMAWNGGSRYWTD
jgi:hypothetical protein